MKDPVAEWKQISDILDQAFDLDEDSRSDFVNQQCEGQPELKARVMELLEADTNSHTFLNSTAAERVAELIVEDESAEKVFGAYKASRLVGYGGMGVVYQAHRADGEFEQRVAIKCLRRVVSDDQIQQRFLAERQILARLQHRSIAYILDGGVDEHGHPWFAMEFVDGENIVEYCNQRALSLSQRIELFLEVCDAVAFAHNNLVVHRDLKPANILVTTTKAVSQTGTSAQVKLLDFGVAGLIDDEVDPKQNQGGKSPVHQPLTPDYAAPEQVLGQPVTVATDIYALGLLLYELVSGQKAQKVTETDAQALISAVCQTVPAIPSSVANARNRRSVKGELDAIVMKALEKRPVNRYQSVAGLVEDLERRRDSLPVSAFRHDASYRLAKFLKRYRWAVAAVSLITVLLAGMTFTSIRSNIEIRHSLEKARVENMKANEIAYFLHQLFELADPFSPAGRQIPVTELLSRGREQIFTGLNSQPETRQALTFELARVHNSLGQYDEAMNLLEEALTIQQTLYGESHEEIARTLHWQSIVADNLGDYARAEECAEKALAMRLEWLDEQSADVGESKDRLASLLAWGGQNDRALVLAREAVATLDDSVGPDDKRSQTARHNLAWMLGTRGLYDEATPLYEQLIEAARRNSRLEHPETLETLNNYAVMLRHMGELQRAEQLYRQVLDARIRLLGEDHPQVAYSQNNLAKLLQQLGQMDEALRLFESSLKKFRAMYGPEHSNVAIILTNTAQVFLKSDQWNQAESYFREALSIHRRVTPPGSVKLASTLVGLGYLLTLQGELEEAQPMLEEALAIQQSALDGGHWQIAETQLRLGQLLARREQTEAAGELIEQAQFSLVNQFGADHPLVLEAQHALALD